MHPASSQGELTVERIQETVAAHFEVTLEDLVSPGRAARISWPRQLAIELSRELTGRPLQAIGSDFGGRSHATVLHACKRVRERINNSVEDAAELDLLRGLLT